MADSKTETSWLLYLAVPLAWFVPGAGHVYLGRRLRGVVIFLTIAATFWAVYAIAGLYLFLLAAGVSTLLVGLALERTARTPTRQR